MIVTDEAIQVAAKLTFMLTPSTMICPIFVTTCSEDACTSRPKTDVSMKLTEYITTPMVSGSPLVDLQYGLNAAVLSRQ
jgi:hypothetical protein